jgi:hypothetical protein
LAQSARLRGSGKNSARVDCCTLGHSVAASKGWHAVRHLDIRERLTRSRTHCGGIRMQRGFSMSVNYIAIIVEIGSPGKPGRSTALGSFGRAPCKDYTMPPSWETALKATVIKTLCRGCVRFLGSGFRPLSTSRAGRRVLGALVVADILVSDQDGDNRWHQPRTAGPARRPRAAATGLRHNPAGCRGPLCLRAERPV